MTATTNASLDTRDRFYVGGAWVEPLGSPTIEVVNPATEQVFGSVPEGTADDVARAVAAARAALPAWSATPVQDRVDLCTAVARRLQERQEELAALVTRELGCPIAVSMTAQLGLAIMDFASMAKVVDEITWEERVGNALVVREPVGVVGAITPWNYPLHQIAAKVAPAMVAGCTVVLKPSEVTPLNALALAEVFDEVGVPAGVLNVVTGYGPVVGEAIARHPEVDMVSFTGSTRAGRRVSALASETVKRVSLELGGKSANIILDDADLAAAIPYGVMNTLYNSGQTCTALTRMLVPRSRLAEVEAIAAGVAAHASLGDPFDQTTVLGPVVSENQRDTVVSYIERGKEEGAKLIAGGADRPEGLDQGYYVKPTVFSEVTPDMTIAREEIFGPVLVIEPYDSLEDAIRIANDSPYGLSGGVHSASEERALEVARQIRTGQVEINAAAFNPMAPFGGYKQSGNGRELGAHGVLEYLETKSIRV